MVGKTGRKCSSHGINVIAGGSQGMENLYKGSPCRKSSKIAIQIHHIVVDITHEHIIWDWFYLTKPVAKPDLLAAIRSRLERAVQQAVPEFKPNFESAKPLE